MLLKVTNSKFCWGKRGIISVETFCIKRLSYNFQTIKWKSLTWSRSIRFLVSSPDSTQEQSVWWCLATPLGFINVDYFLEELHVASSTYNTQKFAGAMINSRGYYSRLALILTEKITGGCVYFTTVEIFLSGRTILGGYYKWLPFFEAF